MKYNKFLTGAFLALAAFSYTAGAAFAENKTVNICTGGKGGNYELTGLIMQNQIRSAVNVNVINTKGSWDNLTKLQSGECDAAVVQSDAIYVWEKERGKLSTINMSDMFKEYVHLLCRRKAELSDISDLTEKDKIFAGEVGSGANVSFRGLINAEKEEGYDSYSKLPLLNEGGRSTLVKLKGGLGTCLVYTASPGTPFMTNDAQTFSDDLALVPITGKYFSRVVLTDENGNESPVWKPAEIDGKVYGKIMPTGFFGGNKNVETFSVDAKFIISAKYAAENDDVFGEIGFALPDVQNILRAEKGLE